jgi:hypothetical protein
MVDPHRVPIHRVGPTGPKYIPTHLAPSTSIEQEDSPARPSGAVAWRSGRRGKPIRCTAQDGTRRMSRPDRQGNASDDLRGQFPREISLRSSVRSFSTTSSAVWPEGSTSLGSAFEERASREHQIGCHRVLACSTGVPRRSVPETKAVLRSVAASSRNQTAGIPGLQSMRTAKEPRFRGVGSA